MIFEMMLYIVNNNIPLREVESGLHMRDMSFRRDHVLVYTTYISINDCSYEYEVCKWSSISAYATFLCVLMLICHLFITPISFSLISPVP